MAPRGRSDEDKRRSSIVVAAYGGPRLAGSKQSSTPSHTSNQAWDCHRYLAPTQDTET